MDRFSLGKLVGIKSIVSFGDSFIYGSELPTVNDAWPGIIAKRLSLDYETRSIPGCGNDLIAQQIYSYFDNHQTDNVLAVINWTWAMRWDFYVTGHNQWITLGPTCVPEKLQNLIDITQSQEIVEFYHKHANSGILWNKIRSLQTMAAVQLFLKTRNIQSIQTYMDHSVFDKEFHCPGYVNQLQMLVEPEMKTWDGVNFLEWSRNNNYLISDQGQHPLGLAHLMAANFWQQTFDLSK